MLAIALLVVLSGMALAIAYGRGFSFWRIGTDLVGAIVGGAVGAAPGAVLGFGQMLTNSMEGGSSTRLMAYGVLLMIGDGIGTLWGLLAMDRFALYQAIRPTSVGSAFVGYVAGVASAIAILMLLPEAGVFAAVLSYAWKNASTVAGYSLFATKKKFA
jgi:hypothetical protein